MSRTPPVVRALDPRWRAVRVGILGGASLFLAAAAHALGGGALPAPGVLAVAGLLLGLVAVPLTVRRCRLPLLLVVLGIEQFGLHAVFGAVSGAAADAAGGPPGCLPRGSAHLLHQALPSCTVGLTEPALTGAGHPLPAGPSLMLVAHLVALLATGWLLARGERWWWRATDRIIAATGPARRRVRSRVAPLVIGALTAAAGRRVAAALPARGPPVPV